jgi:hypothetical protein
VKGTLALSWGPWGGFYVTRSRVCLGFVAITLLRHHEIDDLMEGYLGRDALLAAGKEWRSHVERGHPSRFDKDLFDAIDKAEVKS